MKFQQPVEDIVWLKLLLTIQRLWRFCKNYILLFISLRSKLFFSINFLIRTGMLHKRNIFCRYCFYPFRIVNFLHDDHLLFYCLTIICFFFLNATFFFHEVFMSVEASLHFHGLSMFVPNFRILNIVQFITLHMQNVSYPSPLVRVSSISLNIQMNFVLYKVARVVLPLLSTP